MPRYLKWLLSLVIIVLISLAILVYYLNYYPAKIEKVSVLGNPKAPLLTAGQPLKLLDWNIQFLTENKKDHFFFDGGHDKWHSKANLLSNLQRVVAVIKKINPDVILLQEVDRPSARTHYLDQVKLLLAALPKSYQQAVYASSMKSKYLPVTAMKGKIDFGLVIISKYKINQALRYALGQPSNLNFLQKQFADKRAVLSVMLPIKNGGDLQIMTTQFYAFAKGDPIVTSSVALVQHLLEQAKNANRPAIIGGDFNLLPPFPTALAHVKPENRYLFDPKVFEIVPLFKNFVAIPSLADLKGPNYVRYFTNSGTHAGYQGLDKTIDFYFLTSNIQMKSYQVLQQGTQALSDHVPVIATITVPSPKQNNRN